MRPRPRQRQRCSVLRQRHGCWRSARPSPGGSDRPVAIRLQCVAGATSVPVSGGGEIHRGGERQSGAARVRRDERLITDQRPGPSLGLVVQLALEGLERRAHLLEQRGRRAEQRRRALRSSRPPPAPRAEQAPAQVLLVAGAWLLAKPSGIVCSASSSWPSPSATAPRLNSDRATLAVSPRAAQQGEALLEQRLGALVFTRRSAHGRRGC